MEKNCCAVRTTKNEAACGVGSKFYHHEAWVCVHIALRRWVLCRRLRQAGPWGRCCRRPLGSVREDVVSWPVPTDGMHSRRAVMQPAQRIFFSFLIAGLMQWSASAD